MTTTIYAVLERGGPQGGLLLGVFADRDHAIDVATSHVKHRLQRCRDVDRLAFGRLDPDDYELTQFDAGSIVRVGLTYKPSGEADLMSWIIEQRDVITPPLIEQPALTGLFAHAGGAS